MALSTAAFFLARCTTAAFADAAEQQTCVAADISSAAAAQKRTKAPP